ncbi:hypothetical protein ANO14919_008360 [Xylariales sp. No.14919]|nr:hypothetical protein ANO14919_008360 [Xylariales sp. No.14919]
MVPQFTKQSEHDMVNGKQDATGLVRGLGRPWRRRTKRDEAPKIGDIVIAIQ